MYQFLWKVVFSLFFCLFVCFLSMLSSLQIECSKSPSLFLFSLLLLSLVCVCVCVKRCKSLLFRMSVSVVLFQRRQGVFERFQDGHHDILVATDIASRGLDTINVSQSSTCFKKNSIQCRATPCSPYFHAN